MWRWSFSYGSFQDHSEFLDLFSLVEGDEQEKLSGARQADASLTQEHLVDEIIHLFGILIVPSNEIDHQTGDVLQRWHE